MIPIRLVFSLFQTIIVVAAFERSPLAHRKSCNSIGAEGTSCLTFDTAAASAFCSATITVPTKTMTIYSTGTDTYDITSATLVVTTYASPPITTTTTLTNTYNVTRLSNTTVTINNGDTTSYVSTYTAIVTNTDTVYTCPTAVTKGIDPPVREQIASSDLPPCYSSFVNQHGQDGVTDLCICYGYPTPTTASYVTTTSVQWITSTNTAYEIGTIAITPTVTVTTFVVKSATVSTTSVITTEVPTSANATSTKYITTTTTVTQPSAAPTDGFNIYYYNATALSTLYGRGVNTTSGEGTLIAFGGAADTFGLDTQLRLSDRTDDNEFTSKNTQDPVPYLFLGDTADTANVPTCTVCDGYLHCSYPGTSNDVFALCDGYLALGQVKNFAGLSQCLIIGLEYSIRA